MAKIRTIFGDIQPSELGFTDMHDHIWKSGGMEMVPDHDFALENAPASREELKAYVAAGGKAIVDMQCLGVGRSIEKMCWISEGTGAHIIASTGFQRGELYDSTHFVHRYDPDEILEIIVSEVQEGIEINDFCGPIVKRSPSKAGVIKGGSGYYKISPLELKLLPISARASLATGAPVITHTHQGTMGYEQAKIFKGEGLEPEKICIGHLDRDCDPVYHERVLREGVYVQYDCIARVKYHPIYDTMELIKAMDKKGYGDRIMIGGDWGRASYMKAYGGSPGLEYIPGILAKNMLEYGISEDLIYKIFYENPARYLAF